MSEFDHIHVVESINSEGAREYSAYISYGGSGGACMGFGHTWMSEYLPSPKLAVSVAIDSVHSTLATIYNVLQHIDPHYKERSMTDETPEDETQAQNLRSRIRTLEVAERQIAMDIWNNERECARMDGDSYQQGLRRADDVLEAFLKRFT